MKKHTKNQGMIKNGKESSFTKKKLDPIPKLCIFGWVKELLKKKDY